jgi:protein gp37
VFAIMAATPQHTYQVLTKRPGRMASLLRHQSFRNDLRHALRVRGVELTWPLPNVWLGTSIENQRWAAIRVPNLLQATAATRFASCEPLLGPLDLHRWLGQGLDWVIVGGESGPGWRPVDPDWVCSLRDQCVNAGVAFFFKQWGGRTPKAGGRTLDGRTWDQMPTRRRGGAP